MSVLLKSTEDLPPKLQRKLHDVFGINMLYLSTNGKEGAMFGDVAEPEKPKRRIPMMGEGVAGTDMELNVTEDNGYVGEYIDIGDLLKDSEAAFTVYGNSMTPAYPPGCVVGVKLNTDRFIQPGETYLVLTKSITTPLL
jgi:phage repressor protein C with HTH and peptisase S24 domain